MKFILFIITFILLTLEVQAKEVSKGLTVYTSRKTHLIQPLLDLYKKESGVEVRAITGKAGALIERMRREGKNSSADLLLTVDAGNLWYAGQQKLLAQIHSEKLSKVIPAAYRDPESRWYGLSLRARTIFYHPDKIKGSELTSYEGLADPKFHGRLCLRTSKKVYNQSLVASLIDQYGEKKAGKLVGGWVKNLAKPVFTSDSLLLKAIESGECHVGIANTYYLARLIKQGKSKKVKVFWPNQKTTGVHVNISGAGVAIHSKNKKSAIDFLEWLAGDMAQKVFAEANDEYPVKKGIGLSPLLQNWGSFDKDQRSMAIFGRLQKSAILLMDKEKYK